MPDPPIARRARPCTHSGAERTLFQGREGEKRTPRQFRRTRKGNRRFQTHAQKGLGETQEEKITCRMCAARPEWLPDAVHRLVSKEGKGTRFPSPLLMQHGKTTIIKRAKAHKNAFALFMIILPQRPDPPKSPDGNSGTAIRSSRSAHAAHMRRGAPPSPRPRS